MSLLVILLIVWGAVTTLLILVMIYRSIVGMHEDDQLFLDRAEAQLEQEQKEVLSKLKRTDPWVKLLGITSGVLLAVIVGVWLYQGLMSPPQLR